MLEDSYPIYLDLVFNDAIRLADDALTYLKGSSGECWDKLEEEFAELKLAHNYLNRDEIAGEIGDVIICLIKVAIVNNIDIKEALAATVRKCDKRFDYMRQQAGDELMNLTVDERLGLFREAKRFE